MATLKSWNLNSYTNATWTDLVAGSASGETVKGICIANTTVGAITLQMRVASSGGAGQANILPATEIAAGASFVLDVDPLNLTASQKLQISASAAGLEFYASGISY